jgi:hypothetical protein
MFHAEEGADRQRDRRTDRRIDLTKLLVSFRSFAKAPKTVEMKCNKI